MKMKNIRSLLISYFTFLTIIFFTASCGSAPQPVQNNTVTETVVPIQVIETIGNAVAPVEEIFNPTSISQEYYTTTLDEVQRFIEELNRIITSGNYNAWRDSLSPGYFAEISSPEFLRETSELPLLVARRITLRTPQDYFTNVVVPSRANTRINIDEIDIEFVDVFRVRAFTININRADEEEKLMLYDLEKIDDLWKIIN